MNESSSLIQNKIQMGMSAEHEHERMRGGAHTNKKSKQNDNEMNECLAQFSFSFVCLVYSISDFTKIFLCPALRCFSFACFDGEEMRERRSEQVNKYSNSYFSDIDKCQEVIILGS